MRKKKEFVIITFVFFFVSCATSNKIGIEQYVPVPQHRTYSTQYPFSENGNVILKRDGGFMGSALDAAVFINKEKVADFSPGQYYQLYLPAGTYFVSLQSGKAVNLGTPFERTIKLELNDNHQVVTMRIFPMPGQGMIMEEIYE